MNVHAKTQYLWIRIKQNYWVARSPLEAETLDLIYSLDTAFLFQLLLNGFFLIKP